jgi:hypothetical protein
MMVQTAEGDDLQRLAWMLGVQMPLCAKCKPHKGWCRLLFWRTVHKWRCKHARQWRKMVQGEIRGFSIGGSVQRVR